MWLSFGKHILDIVYSDTVSDSANDSSHNNLGFIMISSEGQAWLGLKYSSDKQRHFLVLVLNFGH